MTLKRALYLYVLCGQMIRSHRELSNGIVTLLKNVSLSSFWGRALNFNLQEMEKEVMMWYRCDADVITPNTIKELVLSSQSRFKSDELSRPDFIKSISGDLNLLKDEILPPDSGLLRFLKGKRIVHQNIVDAWHFVCFEFWTDLKLLLYQERKGYELLQSDDISPERVVSFLDGEYKREMNLATDDERIDSIMHDRLSLISEETKRMLRMFIAHCNGDDDTRVDYLDALRFIKEENEDSIKDFVSDLMQDDDPNVFMTYFNYVVEQTNWMLKYDANNLGVVFQLLNSNIINPETKVKIVELLSKEPYNKKIQRLYNMLREQNPKYREYCFHTKIDELLSLLENQITWSLFKQRDPLCFKVALNAQKTVLLFKTLRSEYIAPDTNIVHFCHIMTGLPIKNNSQYYPINWIHEEKQSLALFIGVLIDFNKEYGTPDYKIGWKTASNLFLFHNEKVSLKSTQYHQAIKSGKYDSLIQKINRILIPGQNINDE